MYDSHPSEFNVPMRFYGTDSLLFAGFLGLVVSPLQAV